MPEVPPFTIPDLLTDRPTQGISVKTYLHDPIYDIIEVAQCGAFIYKSII